MSRPELKDNLHRYRTPEQCGYCGSFSHLNRDCPTPDPELAAQMRHDEIAAVDEIAVVLMSKVQRPAWIRTVLAAFRKAQRLENIADGQELTDLLKSELR